MKNLSNPKSCIPFKFMWAWSFFKTQIFHVSFKYFASPSAFLPFISHRLILIRSTIVTSSLYKDASVLTIETYRLPQNLLEVLWNGGTMTKKCFVLEGFSHVFHVRVVKIRKGTKYNEVQVASPESIFSDESLCHYKKFFISY